MNVRNTFAALAALTAFGGLAYADGPEQGLTRTETKAVTGVTQTKPLGEGAARVDLTKGYVYLSAPQVAPILKTLNAPGPRAPVQGAIAPAGKKAGAADYWITVISYDAIGNVPETGADEIGAINFLDTVKAARPADPLDSFAVAPSYDPVAKNLAWAEQYTLKSSRNSLRYEQRGLGRAGVVGLTTIARPAALEKVKTEAKAARAMVTFNDGQRYSDFVAAADRISDCNLPCLIDGKARAVAVAPAPESAPAAGAFTMADLLPGGKYGWASYLAGGLAVLGLGYGVVRAVSGNKSTPTDA